MRWRRDGTYNDSLQQYGIKYGRKKLYSTGPKTINDGTKINIF
jgi:hypothetical protein